MKLHFDTCRSSAAGFTLLETLVTLAILSVAMLVGVAALRGPSPALQLQRSAAEWTKSASQKRFDAINDQITIIWNVGDFACSNGNSIVSFFEDGSALGPDLCLHHEGTTLRLELMPILGLYKIAGTR